MLIRQGAKADRPEVLTLTGTAFASAERPDEAPVEVGRYDRLFHCAEYIPELSLVAEDRGLLVGSVITTRAWVDDKPVLGLGPRFGFSPASGLGVESPESAWGDHFQGLILPDADGIDATGGTPLTGKFRYAAPIEDL